MAKMIKKEKNRFDFISIFAILCILLILSGMIYAGVDSVVGNNFCNDRGYDGHARNKPDHRVCYNILDEAFDNETGYSSYKRVYAQVPKVETQGDEDGI